MKNIRKCLTIIMTITLLVTSLLLNVSADEHTAVPMAAENARAVVGSVIDYVNIEDSHNINTGRFTINVNGGTYTAFCAQASKPGPTPWAGASLASAAKVNNENLRKVLWYGYGGPGNVLGTSDDAWVQTGQAVSLAYSGQRVHSRYESWYNQVLTYASPPAGFDAYIAVNSNSSYQALAYYTYNPYTSLTIYKKSSCSWVTGVNKPLTGAVFELYAWNGSSFGTKAGIARDNGDGSYTFSNILRTSSADGRFLVVERTAPSGYDKEYFHYNHRWDEYDYDLYGGRVFKLDSSLTWTCASLETFSNPEWGFDFLDFSDAKTLTITKVDSETSEKLTGAEFQLLAYVNGTYSHSVGYFNDNGDGTYSISFYYDVASLRGDQYDYVIRETKAPDGYVMDSALFGGDGYKISYSKVGEALFDESQLVFENTPGNTKLRLEKSSSRPDLTDGNNCYGLKDAEYTIYEDEGLTTAVGTLITDENGKSNEVTLNIGTYYVKETKAPDGYFLDEKVYRVTLTAENRSEALVLEIKDEPHMAPVDILLKKVDGDTGTGEGQSGLSLADAEFEVKYYDVQDCEADPAVSGYEPISTWVFRTDEGGLCKYHSDYLVAGDDLYITDSGEVFLPLGTVTIQEKKAPEGYQLNEELFVRSITYSDAESVSAYVEPVIPENSLKLNLIKLQAGTDIVIPGAVFEHVKPDGSTETFMTDEDGKLSFAGLTWGNHSLREISAPEGYEVNTNAVEFAVSEKNEITVNSRSAVTDIDGTITVSVDSKGNLDVTVEDKPSPYILKLTKKNNKEQLLPGAEFTLYSDQACTDVLEAKMTDSDGVLTIENLIAGETYYLKETKAPHGYQLPKEEIVYEIYAESSPIDEVFDFYVNGEKYTVDDTDSSIEVYLNGTKEKRIVNITVINDAGMLLPDTGSIMTVVLIILGTALMTGVLLVNKLFDKKK